MCELHVFSIAETTTEEQLREHFEAAGPINEVHIYKEEDLLPGEIAISARVIYEDAASVQRAIDELNYTTLDGSILHIFPNDPDEIRIISEGLKYGTGRLVVGHIDKSVDIMQFLQIFSAFGKIVDCDIGSYDEKIGVYYRHVQFREPEAVFAAINGLDNCPINGRPVSLRQFDGYVKRDPDETYTQVYVENLPSQVKTLDDLKEVLAEFDSICYLKGDQLPNGCGLCAFRTHDEAVHAVQSLNGRVLRDEDGREVQLIARRALTSDERSALVKEEIRRKLQKYYAKAETSS